MPSDSVQAATAMSQSAPFSTLQRLHTPYNSLEWIHLEQYLKQIELFMLASAKEKIKLRIAGPFKCNHWWPFESTHKGPVMETAFPSYYDIVKTWAFNTFEHIFE